MLLVLTPVPYVDASSAWGFSDKRKRMMVGAAGIAVELFLGALALFVWLSVEPGAVSSVAYNVMLISGISTLLFNGNPLLRFDGYYVLADAVEIPNLATRSNRYLGYLLRRYLFGVGDADNPADSRGEALWMAFYGVASFVYRRIHHVRDHPVHRRAVLPGRRGARAVGDRHAGARADRQGRQPPRQQRFAAPPARPRRGREHRPGRAGAAVLFVAPVPSWTRAEGVIWVPEEAQVRAGTEGFIVRLLAPADSEVKRGQPLVEAQDPFLRARVALLQAQLTELAAQYDAMLVEDRVQAALVRERNGVGDGEPGALARARGAARDAQPRRPAASSRRGPPTWRAAS